MIKKYEFDYKIGEAHVSFTVDTVKFTAEMAQATLDFFTWDYDKDEDPVTEVLKKYAIEAIWIATKYSLNEYGVTSHFADEEGYGPIDGSVGITLISVGEYEFDYRDLEVKITEQ
jgi:hypothetical protein